HGWAPPPRPALLWAGRAWPGGVAGVAVPVGAGQPGCWAEPAGRCRLHRPGRIEGLRRRALSRPVRQPGRSGRGEGPGPSDPFAGGARAEPAGELGGPCRTEGPGEADGLPVADPARTLVGPARQPGGPGAGARHRAEATGRTGPGRLL